MKHLKLLFSSILKNLLGFLDTGDKCFQFPPFSARFIVAIFRINCGIHQLANLDKSEKDKDFAKKFALSLFCVVFFSSFYCGHFSDQLWNLCKMINAKSWNIVYNQCVIRRQEVEGGRGGRVIRFIRGMTTSASGRCLVVYLVNPWTQPQSATGCLASLEKHSKHILLHTVALSSYHSSG